MTDRTATETLKAAIKCLNNYNTTGKGYMLDNGLALADKGLAMVSATTDMSVVAECKRLMETV